MKLDRMHHTRIEHSLKSILLFLCTDLDENVVGFSANPWIYAPRWFGIFFVPVLTLVIPYAIYQGIVSNNLDSHG